MGINKRYVEKFDKAYEGLPPIEPGILFHEDSPHYHEEVWKDVLPMYVPGVLPNTYKISTHGRVYSALRSPKYPNGSIMVHSVNPKGYHQINLQSVDHKKIGIKITRLMMLHFCFIPNCHRYEIDHIDGNKDHNFIWNLQWVTPQENVHRAIANYQRTASIRSDSFDILTNEQAYELYNKAKSCFAVELEDLAREYNVSVSYIKNLVEGRIRPYIADKYAHGEHLEMPESMKNYYVQ